MQQRFASISLLATILAALALTGPARAEEQVPFTGWSSGDVVTTEFSPPFLSTVLNGEGKATHLGHFTVHADVVVNVTTGIATGPWTLTAANGDTLFVTFVGCGVPPAHGFGNMTIVGGTGRFQGATGHYTQSITFSNPPRSEPSVSYTDVLEGTISLPGSN